MKAALERIKKDIRENLLLISLLLGVPAVLFLAFHSICPVVIMCGFPCPGCGLTRAFLCLISLRPQSAWDYNPCIWLWVLLGISAAFRRYHQGKSLKALRVFLVMAVVITVAVYLWRMRYAFPGDPPMAYTPGNLLGLLLPGYDDYCRSHFTG